MVGSIGPIDDEDTAADAVADELGIGGGGVESTAMNTGAAVHRWRPQHDLLTLFRPFSHSV